MMADVARRKKTEGKRQYGAYSADEQTLSQSPGISLSVVRRSLHHCVIIAHIPYIYLKKKKKKSIDKPHTLSFRLWLMPP